MKVLALGAHPDDIEIYMYGLLSNFASRNNQIKVVVATDGARGTVKKSDNLASIRKKEAINGLSKFGTPIFLDFPDGGLSFNNEYFKRIKKFFVNIEVDLVITHSPEDYHPDHRALSNYVIESVGFKAPILFADTLMGVNFVPEIYTDITEHFEEKKRAIMCHKSQNPKKFKDAVTLLNRFRSAQCNAPDKTYAECYRSFSRFPYPDISSLIPNKMEIKPYYKNHKYSFL